MARIKKPAEPAPAEEATAAEQTTAPAEPAPAEEVKEVIPQNVANVYKLGAIFRAQEKHNG